MPLPPHGFAASQQNQASQVRLPGHRLILAPRALLVLGLTIVVVAFGGCYTSGGEIPGLRPPLAHRTDPTGSTAASPTPIPSPSEHASTAGSSTGRTPTRPNKSLAKNSIYAVDLGGTHVSCKVKVRSPKPPLKDANLTAYGKKLVGCLVKAFAKPLAAHGITLTTPKIKAYHRTIKTPCGRFNQRGAPAYYCSATRTIYWPVTGDDGPEAYTYARLGYVGLVAHEFGHHLQAESGMLREYGRRAYRTKGRSERYLLSRRLELQAQCFEGVFLAATARSIGLSSNDRYQLGIWHAYTGDEDPPASRKPDHGSSAAQIRWLNRGLDSADFARCNTWKASKKSVK
ncbi:MAG TPA: neutral zinc metallopeptidase [Propionibacteriaceae bacterium]